MFLEIRGLLNSDEVARLAALAREVKFVDGRISNPDNQTKNNLQADAADPRYNETVRIVMGAMTRSAEFRDFSFARRIAPPLLCRYEPGMKYGAHADVAYMQVAGGVLRSDVSCTVFISDPSSYDGGELTLHMGLRRPITVKGAPGDAVLYPSTMLHEVAPVTRGQRIVSITFIESLIPEQHQREILYELNEIGALEGLNMRWENRVRLEVVRQNLTRLWSK